MTDPGREGRRREADLRAGDLRAGDLRAGAPRAGALGPGVEFDRIRGFLGGMPPHGPDVRLGPGDDACVLADGWVISTDLSVEGVHFRLEWIGADEAGYRAAAAGLSDLAAMAAEPVGVLVSIAAPGDGMLAEQAMEGVKEVARTCGASLLGGDLTRSPGPLVIDVVSVGRSADPLLRSGARAGDELWVTGSLGGAAAAAALWQQAKAVPDPLREAFVAPKPRLSEARWLREIGVGAGLDLSDGIAGDSAHLAAASGVRVILAEGALPLHPALAGASLPPDVTGLLLALHGGEDYELLVAARPGLVAPRVEEFARQFDLVLSRVGRVVPGEGVFLEAVAPGPLRRLKRGGFDHFGKEKGG